MSIAHRPRRTWLAITLVFVAVAAPCTAWYVVGQASAEREAASIRARPVERGHSVARALSDRLVGRLEAMRDSESQRPPYHFHATYHDPTSNCQCAGSTPSPLATGPRDPFVDVYFQIDPRGRLSVPVLGDLGEIVPDADRLQRAGERRKGLHPHADTLQLMARSGRDPLPPSRSAVASLDPSYDGRLLVETESFQWHGLEDGLAEPLLVALRRVGDDGAVQGFVLSPHAVHDWLRSAELPAVLRPFTGGTEDSVAVAEVPLDCTTWEIAVDVSGPVALAGVDAARVETDFYRSFAIGSAAALIAAVSVVVLLLNAERVARERSRFAAAAAHELRTPLAGLRMYGEMLGGVADDPDRSQRYARRIAAESERLSRVVTNVLDFTRLERGDRGVRMREGDLAATLREVASRLGPALESHGATLEVDVPETLPSARFDPDAVEHIVTNLIDNAEKYSRSSDDRRVHLSAMANGSRVHLSVRDHGPGIPDDVARSLFEPFRRGDDEDQPAGLGLGLALVDRLARAHGSEVEWENREDGGARFRVGFERVE